MPKNWIANNIDIAAGVTETGCPIGKWVMDLESKAVPVYKKDKKWNYNNLDAWG